MVDFSLIYWLDYGLYGLRRKCDSMKKKITSSSFMIAVAVIAAFCAVILGRCTYLSEYENNMSYCVAETISTAANVDSLLDDMVKTFDNEVTKMEAFLNEKEQSDEDITEYLRSRTRWLSTSVDAIYVDLFCTHSGKYLCGNYWHPPKNFDVSSRPWYKAALAANGKTTTIPPYMPNDYSFQLIAVSRKLSHPDTVLSLDVQLSPFEPVISETQDSNSERMYIFAPNGTIIDSQYTSKDISGNLQPVIREAMKRYEDNGAEEPFLFGDDFVFSRRTNNGWWVVLLHDKEDILLPAKWAALNPLPWVMLGFMIVYLLVELLRYRSDLVRYKDIAASRLENHAHIAVLLAAVVGFFGIVWFGQHQVLHLENSIAITNAEDIVSNAIAPVVAFIETARGATGYCSRHIDRLMRSGADSATLAAETKELVGIYRSMPNRNYHSIFVLSPSMYANSIGWEPADGNNLCNEDFYINAIENPNENVFTPPYVSPADGSEVLTITRAVGDNAKTVVGIDIPLKMLQSLAMGLRVEGGMCALLITKTGHIIDQRFFGAVSQGIDALDIKSIISLALNKPGSFQFTNEKGQKLQAISVPISIGGRAIVIGDERMLNKTISVNHGRALAAFVVIFLVALLFVFITFRRMRFQRERNIVVAERARQADALAEALEGSHNANKKLAEQKILLSEQQSRLQEALAMAQSSNRAKTTFLNNMSHDMRTPMNAIIGFANLASKHIGNSEKTKDYLGKITQSSTHLLSLINDVLDMSRIESGKMTINEKPENLTTIVNAICDILQADVNDKKQLFSLDTRNVENVGIVCDKLRLSQVLINILSNAIKYTPSGGTISMSITEKPCDKPGHDKYIFLIKDNGIGMEENFIKTIFEPFTRAKSSTVSGIQGTGLGMAITKNIIDMMNGEIKVKSKPGEGTEITVSFDFTLHEITPEPVSSSSPSFFGKHILLVEDNPLNREIATEILSEAGFVVDTAEDGTKAVETICVSKKQEDALINSNGYSLILMDIQMPKMNGYEAAKRIREWERQESERLCRCESSTAGNSSQMHIPIIAMTANAFEEDRKLAFEAGMDEHIAKPIDVEKMKEILSRFV